MVWLIGLMIGIISCLACFRGICGLGLLTWIQGRRHGFKAWHFLPKNGRTRFSHLPVKEGDTLIVNPNRVEMCKFGLHASSNFFDALDYSPGSLLTRVVVRDNVECSPDKLVGASRTCLKMYPQAEAVILHWALLVARGKYSVWSAYQETFDNLILTIKGEIPVDISLFYLTGPPSYFHCDWSPSANLRSQLVSRVALYTLNSVAINRDSTWQDIISGALYLATRRHRRLLLKMLREAGIQDL